MIVKQHKNKRGLIVALCDKATLGKKFSEGDIVLDLSSGFYNGKRLNKEKALKICKNAYIINAAGKDSVELLLKRGFISQKNIVKIREIPFAQCVILENEM